VDLVVAALGARRGIWVVFGSDGMDQLMRDESRNGTTTGYPWVVLCRPGPLVWDDKELPNGPYRRIKWGWKGGPGPGRVAGC